MNSNILQIFDNTVPDGDVSTVNSISWGNTTLRGQFEVGEVNVVQTPGDLEKFLLEGMEITTNHYAGADTIWGGDGNDIIFGDRFAMSHDGSILYDLYDEHGVLNQDIITAMGLESDASLADIQQYIFDHQDQFNISSSWDKGDEIHARGGNDLIFAGGGNDTVYLDSGNNIVYAGGGNDIIYGGSGNDVIYGGTGNDVMHSGAGSTTFAWGQGDLASTPGSFYTDTIKDFNASTDKLLFRDILPDDRESLDNYLSIKSEGGNTIIELHSANDQSQVMQTIILENVTLSADELMQLFLIQNT